MELSYAFLADAAEVLPAGGFFIFNGGIEELFCSSVPALRPTLAVVAKIRILPDERDRPHLLEVRGPRPNNEPFTPTVIDEIQPRTDGPPGDRPSYHPLVVDFLGLTIQESGLHRFILEGDGQKLRSIHLQVDVAASPVAQTDR
jgi:Family of unknown function (DUF6941)